MEGFQTPNLDLFFWIWWVVRLQSFDPAVLTGISWRSQCSQRKSYLLLLRRFWKMLGIYKCHCCNRLVDTSLQTNTPKTKWALYRLHTVDSTIFTQNHFEYIFCWGGKNRNPFSNPFLKQTKVFPGSTQGWWTQRWGRRKRPCGRGLCALAGTHGAAAFRGTADLTTAFHWNPGRANPPVDEMRRVAAAFFFPPWSECFPPKDK